MSTFEGDIKEFPGIRIDQFEDEKASIYFLSHIHSDHMHGLSNWSFQSRLLEQKLPLYASEQSTMMLSMWYPNCSEQFMFLPMHVSTILKTADNFHFTVTLLPAGHCPGSVMFLFENDQHCILYTGDFRVPVHEFKKFKLLYTPYQKLKHINKVHLDTTFMFKQFRKFPTREQSCEAVCNLIAEWIEVNDEHWIHLDMPYYYGAEIFYMDIFKRFKIPVYVSNRTYECYKFFPNLDKCITSSTKGSICAITKYENHLIKSFRPDYSMKYMRKIILSAMCWTEWNNDSSIIKKDEDFGDNVFRVCYSTHASYEEIMGILEFLKPDSIEANVMPKDKDEQDELLLEIEEYNNKFDKVCSVNEGKDKEEESSTDDSDDLEYERLMKVKKSLAKKIKLDDDDLDLSILE